MKIKNFRTKLSLVCSSDDLRPVLQNIYFNDGYAVATDCHVIVKQSLKEHAFTEDEIKIMNGKFIHKQVFNEIFRFDVVKVTEDGFNCIKKQVKVLISFSEVDGKYPISDKIFDNLKESLDVDEIGMNGNLIKTINDVSLSYMKTYKFKFFGKDKGIKVIANDLIDSAEQIILMPVKLN